MAKFMNVVRFTVKSGEEAQFEDSLKKFINPDGVLFRKVIKTGDTP